MQGVLVSLLVIVDVDSGLFRLHRDLGGLVLDTVAL